MNWKVKTVLLFGKIRKPFNPQENLSVMRRHTERAAWLGSFLFDEKIPIASVVNGNADGVPVRIYSNSSSKNQRVIIYLHGGGFVLYGLQSHDFVCRRLCAMNKCIVVAVDYRLAPEHSFPAAHEDAFKVIQWTTKNIARHGGDASKIILCGDSAGDNLSACMAHRCKKQGIPIQAQILIYPYIDGKLSNPSIERNGEGYLLTKEAVFWFQKQYTPAEADHCNPLVSPLYETDFTGLPPAFILTAEFDPLLDDGVAYCAKLKDAGNKVIYKEYKQLFHGFFNTPKVSREAMSAFHDIKEFLNGV